MGNLSQNLDEMLAIAVATRLVKSLEVELRSSKRRRKMADELEDRADDVLLLRPTSLKQLDENFVNQPLSGSQAQTQGETT